MAAKQDGRVYQFPFSREEPDFTPDGRWLILRALNGLTFHDVRTGAIVGSDAHDEGSNVIDVCYSRDGRRAARVVVDNLIVGLLRIFGKAKPIKIELWDRTTKHKLADLDLPGVFGSGRILHFSPNGKYLVGKSPQESFEQGRPVPGVVFDGTTGKVKYQLPKTVQCAAFSPDSRWLAIGLKGKADLLQIRDAETGAVVRVLPEHRGDIKAIAFSPNGQWLGVAGDKETAIWEAATGRQLFTLRNHFKNPSGAPYNRCAPVGGGGTLDASPAVGRT